MVSGAIIPRPEAVSSESAPVNPGHRVTIVGEVRSNPRPEPTQYDAEAIVRKPVHIKRLGLTTVYEPENKSAIVADVVFVHGLGGHPYETWRYKEKAVNPNGLADGDQADGLNQRLAALSPKVEDMYLRILDNLSPKFREEGSLIFWFVCFARRPLKVKELTVAVETMLQVRMEQRRRLNRISCEDFSNRIKSRSGGLLDFTDEQGNYPHQARSVNLTRETVKTYLMDSGWLRSRMYRIGALVISRGAKVGAPQLSWCIREDSWEMFELHFTYFPPGLFCVPTGLEGNDSNVGPLWLLCVAARKGAYMSSAHIPDFGRKLDLLLEPGEDINGICGPAPTLLHATLGFTWSSRTVDEVLIRTLVDRRADVNAPALDWQTSPCRVKKR
ncbi:hypothetical protein EPUS_00313 [Endocarpon pusillum Z07020]|uniref:Uncharacterized protein n=1 Tax=Endocarpon pusillum (strain Z07020 / HMAS-L-300199) TaxID=1263415 RepID=U1GEJ9_ENDPU|nr:uncharacterized protein EPUS_00313 [Endocarpon pusillum Z07020]ERF70126.1 hypothetical protein EPUS_00313 [Endocarpon pusillum Z07020]